MKPLIELSGVSKHYHLGEATVPALTAVDLLVRQGEFTALAGPSGSGKTTLPTSAAAGCGRYRFVSTTG